MELFLPSSQAPREMLAVTFSKALSTHEYTVPKLMGSAIHPDLLPAVVFWASLDARYLVPNYPPKIPSIGQESAVHSAQAPSQLVPPKNPYSIQILLLNLYTPPVD